MLLKPSLENFEDYFAGMWDKCDLLWEWFEVNCCYKGPDTEMNCSHEWEHLMEEEVLWVNLSTKI